MTHEDVQADTGIPKSPNAEELDPFRGVDFSQLERSLRRPRTFVSMLLSGIVAAMTLFALIPLFSVVGLLLWRGGRKLSIAAFTQLPPAPLEQNGGFGNAILGTLVIVGMAMLISVPIGVLSAIFLAQAKSGSRLASTVRFAAKVLTGFPSILAGVFAYGVVVTATGGYSALAGAVALSILMLPTILLTAEDAIRMVPSKMKEAAIGMGATDTQTVWMVLLPTAVPHFRAARGQVGFRGYWRDRGRAPERVSQHGPAPQQEIVCDGDRHQTARHGFGNLRPGAVVRLHQAGEPGRAGPLRAGKEARETGRVY
jgi:phosphate transport system permease protein